MLCGSSPQPASDTNPSGRMCRRCVSVRSVREQRSILPLASRSRVQGFRAHRVVVLEDIGRGRFGFPSRLSLDFGENVGVI